MIYIVHPDYLNYKSFVFDHKAVRRALGSDTQFHFARAPRHYRENWQPFEISFESLASSKGSLPDIMVRNGRLFLSETATQVLHKLIASEGELLPVNYQNQNGMLFNVLATAEDVDGINTQLSLKNEFGEVVALTFQEDNLTDLNVFRTSFDNYMSVYCNERFKSAVESAGLKGLIFSSDTGTQAPPDVQAKSPSKQ